jgi:hypothetical protein
MVTQPVNRLDFADITDTGKIFLAKLSEGLLGKENSYLLGALLVSKFQQLAMSRQAQRAALRKDFWLYMDEFHNFITPSLSEILTGARKYRMGLVLAHHELRQLERDKEVASAVLANCYTRIVFRVGDDDSRKLADGFASFDARDLQNLPIGQAICRVERSDADFNLSVVLPEEVDENDATNRRQEVITISRETFATPRSEIERAQSQLAAIEPEREIVQKVTKEKVQIHKEESPKVYAPASPPPADPLPVEMLPPAILEQKISKNPPDLGRGGAQHQAIQLRIKEAAEKLGFRCVIEKPVLDGKGSVDLLLERDDQGIACEISISTTIDHEVRNALKCLKAGFQEVAVICIDETRLKRIEAAVIGSLGAALALKVKYYQPDQFIARLQELSRPVPKPAAAPQVRRGYKVKRSVPKLTPEEQKLREEAAIRSIAEAMRSKHT